MHPETRCQTPLASLLPLGPTTAEALDRLSRLALRALGGSAALVSVIDGEQQHVLGCAGLAEPWASARRMPSARSLCALVAADAAPLIAPDARADPRLSSHPATVDPGVVAYAGVPVSLADELCAVFAVSATAPRDWGGDVLAALGDLARLAAGELAHQATARAYADAVRSLGIREAQLALVDRELPLVLWATDSALRLTSLFGTGLPDLPSDPTPFLGQPVDRYFATTGVPHALVARSLAAHRQALAGTPFTYQRELWGQSAVVQVEPLRDVAGRVVGCLGGIIPLTAPVRLLHEVQAARNRLQSLSAQLLQAQEAERRAIARELHDEIGQELTVIQLQLQDLLEGDPAQLPANVEETLATVERVLDQVRAMALDLRPAQLDDLGLAEALRWYLERHAVRAGLEVVLDLPPLSPRPPAQVETTCFRIAQEAVTNILRSAHASHAWVSVTYDADALTLRVRDDGRGFDVGAARSQLQHGASLGLLNMEERAALLGGRCTIESTLGQGTLVQAWLPLRLPATEEAS